MFLIKFISTKALRFFVFCWFCFVLFFSNWVEEEASGRRKDAYGNEGGCESDEPVSFWDRPPRWLLLLASGGLQLSSLCPRPRLVSASLRLLLRCCSPPTFQTAPPLSPSWGASHLCLHNVDTSNKIPHSLCPTGQRSFAQHTADSSRPPLGC